MTKDAYKPTLTFDELHLTLNIDPGPGYNKGAFNCYFSANNNVAFATFGVQGAGQNVRLTAESMRDLITVMTYCLSQEEEHGKTRT